VRGAVGPPKKVLIAPNTCAFTPTAITQVRINLRELGKALTLMHTSRSCRKKAYGGTYASRSHMHFVGEFNDTVWPLFRMEKGIIHLSTSAFAPLSLCTHVSRTICAVILESHLCLSNVEICSSFQSLLVHERRTLTSSGSSEGRGATLECSRAIRRAWLSMGAQCYRTHHPLTQDANHKKDYGFSLLFSTKLLDFKRLEGGPRRIRG
jgi:hypothetical protein